VHPKHPTEDPMTVGRKTPARSRSHPKRERQAKRRTIKR
jgi:hypothetical protein